MKNNFFFPIKNKKKNFYFYKLINYFLIRYFLNNNMKKFLNLFTFILLITKMDFLLISGRSNTMENDEKIEDIKNQEMPDLNKDIILRPQDININFREHAFHDTIMNLNAESSIRIKIKVHNTNVFPFFN